MLEISGIDVYRGETQVLWDVSIEVHLGERVAILGSNGAGKSSLLGAVTGVLRPRRGEIKFKGESLVGLKPHQITQLGVALVPEGRRVYKDMTVLENLELLTLADNCRRNSVWKKIPKELASIVMLRAKVQRQINKRDPRAFGLLVSAPAIHGDAVDHLAERGITGRRVAVLLHGSDMAWFAEALQRLGAEVTEVPVYRVSAPEFDPGVARLREAAALRASERP